MSRKVDSTSGTVDIGAGLTWENVYVALESTGVNVGGRNPGLGVSGVTLGGGGVPFLIRELWISDTCTQASHISQVSMDLRLTPLPDMTKRNCH
jgi:hypothetical protein